MDAAFEEGDLPAPQRLVDLGKADVVRRSVVGREEDECVVFETVVAQSVRAPSEKRGEPELPRVPEKSSVKVCAPDTPSEVRRSTKFTSVTLAVLGSNP